MILLQKKPCRSLFYILNFSCKSDDTLPSQQTLSELFIINLVDYSEQYFNCLIMLHAFDYVSLIRVRIFTANNRFSIILS